VASVGAVLVVVVSLQWTTLARGEQLLLLLIKLFNDGLIHDILNNVFSDFPHDLLLLNHPLDHSFLLLHWHPLNHFVLLLLVHVVLSHLPQCLIPLVEFPEVLGHAPVSEAVFEEHDLFWCSSNQLARLQVVEEPSLPVFQGVEVDARASTRVKFVLSKLDGDEDLSEGAKDTVEGEVRGGEPEYTSSGDSLPFVRHRR
jgi:hypothetical protein